MEFTLWGVRGSIANATESNIYYGANTTCIELRLNSGDTFIFDAGTGLNALSQTMPKSGECHLFITHSHADHVQGMSFFSPMYNPAWTVNVYLPEWDMGLLERCFDGSSFPVSFHNLKANIVLHPVAPGSVFDVAGAKVETYQTNHPGGCIAYKVKADGEVFVFSGDHEISPNKEVQRQTEEILRDATIAVVDAAYSRDNFRPGWGHSAWEDWVGRARAAGVNSLVLTHHAQFSLDKDLDDLQTVLRNWQREGFRCVVGREHMRFPVMQGALSPAQPSNWLSRFIDTLAQYKEESVVLDRILAKTREITGANAGTIYLRQDDELVFAYTHNDALFPQDMAYKHAYTNMRLPITSASIAGYVAVTNDSLNIADVQNLPDGAPYKFNDSFDRATGYVTKSLLTVPILSHGRNLLGVVQLINSLTPGLNTPRPFTDEMVREVSYLAREAAIYLEVSNNMRENIYRLMEITVLRDPTETGAHAERVGALAAEVYQRWAERHEESVDMIRFYRSQLRLAAMLHDVGKVAIPDVILKKPGRLTEDEFAVMRTHTTLGAGLFSPEMQDITGLTHDIAMHHHQRWDGNGYPANGKGPLADVNIPLAARITAIADVFDALVSPRCYKEPWPMERAYALLEEEAGRHFDPELISCFVEIKETIPLIYKRFPDIELVMPEGNAAAKAEG